MAMTSTNASFLLDEVVSGVAYETFFEEAYMWPNLYDIRTSSSRRERLASFGGLGEWAQKVPGQEPDDDRMIQQFEKDFVHKAYGKRVPVERELVDDNDWGLVQEIGVELGASASYTMELHAAQLFHDAFAGATYTAEDGDPLCDATHLNVDGGNTQGNTGTTAFSMAALKSTVTLMRKFTNYGGELRSVRPKLILCPPDIEEDVWEVAKSALRPDNANNAANFWQGMQMLVWDYLSDGVTGGDANNWFLIDPVLMRRNLIHWQRVPLEFFGDGNLLTGTRTVGGYFRVSRGVRDWRWIYGHAVA
jgi:hypothetical protein